MNSTPIFPARPILPGLRRSRVPGLHHQDSAKQGDQLVLILHEFMDSLSDMPGVALRLSLRYSAQPFRKPLVTAFRTLWPAAERVNLLEDSLSPDRARDGRLTSRMTERFRTLGHYAAMIGAKGVLFTCSAFGPAIEAVAAEHTMPVLKPNEAMFEAALARGRRIGMLATFEPSIAPMSVEFEQIAPATTLETILVDGAMAALQAGDGASHDRLLSEAASRLQGCDGVMLAHFSTARAEAAVAARLDCPVLTAPGSAVRKLKSALEPS